MIKMLIFSVSLMLSCFFVVSGSGMIEVFQWTQVDYVNTGINPHEPQITPSHGDRDRVIFPDNKWRTRRQIITSRDNPIGVYDRSNIDSTTYNNISYIAYNNVPMGASHFKGRLFITVPRRRLGVVSTLNYIDLKTEKNKLNPKLRAYPNFETNALHPDTLSDPERLISVYRTTVDKCQRLWFIDTGMLEYPNNFTQVKRPAIWIVDLNTDAVLRRFEIPQSIAQTGRGLASISVEVDTNNCIGAFAYLPDLVYNRLYVYNYANNRIWSFNHNYFNFDPLGGDLSIGGQKFRWNDGIFSTTLGTKNKDGYRNLYFHAMASNNEFMVSTEVLQNEENAARSDHGNDFRPLGSRGERHQSTMHEFDERTGVIFYNEIQRNGVGCWNSRTPFNSRNHGTVIQDDQRMIYPSDLTIDNDGTLWVMTNSMPIFIYSNLEINTVNFRVWKQSTVKAKEGTICE